MILVSRHCQCLIRCGCGSRIDFEFKTRPEHVQPIRILLCAQARLSTTALTLTGDTRGVRSERSFALSGLLEGWISLALLEVSGISAGLKLREDEEDETQDEEDEVKTRPVEGDASLAGQVFGRAYKDTGTKSEVSGTGTLLVV